MIDTGMGIQQNQQAMADQAYQRALNSMAQRRQMMGSLFGAAGAGLGAYLGAGALAGKGT